MANTWDPFPFPKRGDLSEDAVYIAVGKVIDHWERVEFELARSYSLFAGDSLWEKMREYGGVGGYIFKDRAARLAKSAEKYFIRHPNQEHEGDFDLLMVKAIGFSDRRNEVAHGMAMNVQEFLFWLDKMPEANRWLPQNLWVPPYYHSRKHDSLGLPAFGYSSVELEILRKRLFNLELEIDAFNEKLWPRATRQILA
jgi:hypothetical protein